MYEIGVFATGRGQGSRQLVQAIHQAVQSGHLKARVSFVFSNRDPGEFEPTDDFLKMVREFGYPLVASSFRKFKAGLGDDPDWRSKYDREVIRLLKPYEPDVCVLAGYLLIWSPVLCHRYQAVNLHPAAPGGPIGMWQQVIWQLIEAGARMSGNTMFHVTEELDRGPTVTFCTFPLTGGEIEEAWREAGGRRTEELRKTPGEELRLFQMIRRRGMAREKPLVVETLRAFAEGEIRISGEQVMERSGRPVQGIDLTPEIETQLRRTGEGD